MIGWIGLGIGLIEKGISLIELVIGRLGLGIGLIELRIGLIELGIGLIELGIGLIELGIGLRINNARRTVLARVSGLVYQCVIGYDGSSVGLSLKLFSNPVQTVSSVKFICAFIQPKQFSMRTCN